MTDAAGDGSPSLDLGRVDSRAGGGVGSGARPHG